MTKHILAIDQGTTSSRAIVFDQDLSLCGQGQQEFPQHFPQSGWVEHDPDDIWQTCLSTCQEALQKASLTAKDLKAIGITNQRETTLVWRRDTGACIYPAIVWQDRRTAARCAALKETTDEAKVTNKTGLLLDPYFSASKIQWILENCEGAQQLAQDGKLAFGTVDSFLIWKLSGGTVHATDATNASRTLLFNIRENTWDDELLELFSIPRSMLPTVQNCADDFGVTDATVFGAEIPICGVAGDQQAATIGQACFQPGMIKSTFGTGAFALLNTGADLIYSNNRLLSTIAYRFDNKTTYALEGSLFIAGAAVQWLRDGLNIIDHAAETQALAESADPTQNVYLVPAFTGLGAPYWDAEARGAIYGLTRNTGPAEIARATLESIAYQTRDLISAMQSDWRQNNTAISTDLILRVDGGMTASDWTLQALANTLKAPVDRPVVTETTALGAAYLAGLGSGLYPGLDDFAKQWQLDKRFTPEGNGEYYDEKYAGWLDCIERTRT